MKMGFFNRRRNDGTDTSAGPANGHQNRHVYDTVAYTMAVRPSFGQWLKVTWVDIVTMICMGAIGLGVCSIALLRNSYFYVGNCSGH